MSSPSFSASVFMISRMRTISVPFILKKPIMTSMASRASGSRSGESRSIMRISIQPDISHSSRAPTTVSPLTRG